MKKITGILFQSDICSPFECCFRIGIFSSCSILFVIDSAVGELEAIVLALCCHHRCDWQTYTGKEFFTDLGLSARDFHLICSMTSWATCATRTFLNKLAERETERDNENSEALGHKDDSKITEEEAQIEESEPERKRTKIDADKETSDLQQKHSEPAGEHESPGDDGEYCHPRYGSLTPEQREEVGYQCKKLIDIGRLKFIESHGFNVQLVKYTTSELSLENVALLATRKVSGAQWNFNIYCKWCY